MFCESVLNRKRKSILKQKFLFCIAYFKCFCKKNGFNCVKMNYEWNVFSYSFVLIFCYFYSFDLTKVYKIVQKYYSKIKLINPFTAEVDSFFIFKSIFQIFCFRCTTTEKAIYPPKFVSSKATVNQITVSLKCTANWWSHTYRRAYQATMFRMC